MKLVSTILLLVLGVAAFAQQSDTINAGANVVIQDKDVTAVTDKYKSYLRHNEFADGYRIQISSTDMREDVYKNKSLFYRDFPDLNSYVDYESPTYKLKVGDYKTRLEATYYLQQVMVLYPGAFIVKDKIKIKQ
jgi:hypothetical protein